MKEDALAAFDLYVHYLDQAESISLSAYEAEDMADWSSRAAELRRPVLGRQLAEAFFGADEAREAFLTGQRRIATDPVLSAEERSRQLAALEQALPENMQQARRQATAMIRLRDETRALKATGADDVIHYLREENVGVEAGGRLRELDVQRQDWQRRLSSYQRERDAVIGSAELTGQDRERLLAEVRARYFAEPEPRRMRALDSLSARGGPGGS